MEPWFIATTPFGPEDGPRWVDYQRWSGLAHLTELVSLDPMLCPTVLPTTEPTYWPHIVNQDFMLDYFVDLGFLRAETAPIERKNLLCVFRDPPAQPVAPPDLPFEFLGYDLVDEHGLVSALSNCGGFPDVFAGDELTQHGLLANHARGFEVKAELRARHPDDAHARCHAWAVFRARPDARYQ